MTTPHNDMARRYRVAAARYGSQCERLIREHLRGDRGGPLNRLSAIYSRAKDAAHFANLAIALRKR